MDVKELRGSVVLVVRRVARAVLPILRLVAGAIMSVAGPALVVGVFTFADAIDKRDRASGFVHDQAYAAHYVAYYIPMYLLAAAGIALMAYGLYVFMSGIDRLRRRRYMR